MTFASRFMKRSRLLAGWLGMVAGVGVARASASGAEYQYKLATADPPEIPTVVRLVQMCGAIKAETNGRVQITVFPSSVLGISERDARSASPRFHSIHESSAQRLRLSRSGGANQQSRFCLFVRKSAVGRHGRLARRLHSQRAGGEGDLRVREELGDRLSGDHLFGQTDSHRRRFRRIQDSRHPRPIFVDLFKMLGASPLAIDANETYTALQTHLADGEETGLVGIEGFRYYEVQKYLSLTNHIWGGQWLVANADVWNALPSDIQAVIQRNAAKHAMLVRNSSFDGRRPDRQAPAPRFGGQRSRYRWQCARLGPYYARWKNEFGSTAWGLLEASLAG